MTTKTTDTNVSTKQPKLTNKLLNLPPDVVVTGCTTHPYADEIHVVFPQFPPMCSSCGSLHCHVKSSPKKQTVRHTTCSGRPTLLTFEKPRFLCCDCRKTFYSTPDLIHPSLRMTTTLFGSIFRDLTKEKSILQAAEDNGVTAAIVGGVLASLSFPKPEHLPMTLCIDEFKGNAGEWNTQRRRWDKTKFLCSIVDPDSSAVTDILPFTNAASLKKYFMEYPLEERRKVKFFCCDMHGGYISVAKDCFPECQVCIDPFHVVKRVNAAVDEVRRRIQNEIRITHPEQYEILKHSSKLLTTKESNRGTYWVSSMDRRLERLDAIYDAFPELCTVCDALQNFHVILDEKQYALQRAALTEWINGAFSSEIPELTAAAGTIKHWRSYILNSFKYRKSNGPCEGLNRKIKNLMRLSYGIHEFNAFRKRILLVCGYFGSSCRSSSMKQLLGTSTPKAPNAPEGGEDHA